MLVLKLSDLTTCTVQIQSLKLNSLLIVSHFHLPYSLPHSNHSFGQISEQNRIPLRERLREPPSFLYKRYHELYPPGGKTAENERCQLSSFIAMVKNAWSYATSPSQFFTEQGLIRETTSLPY